MSSTAPAAPGGTQAASAVRPTQAAGGRKPGTEEDNGLFANLLMLVSDTRTSVNTDAGGALGAPPDDAPALTGDTPTSELLATQPGGALEARLAGLERGLGQPMDRAAAGGPAAQADGANELPPGMTATRGTAADADAAALALAEQAPPPGAPGRPAPAAPFLGRRGDAGSTSAAGAASLQGFQWRKGQAPADARALAGAGGIAGMPAAGTAPPFNSLAAAASGRAAARSTVALHERFGASPGGSTAGTETPAAGSTLGFVSALSPGAGVDARTAPAAQAAGDAGSEAGPSESADATPTENPPNAADAAAQAAEDEARQISHWGTQTLRHASLRVGQDGGDAIDIRLSLAGQEVQVDFRTDSAEARASLQQNASESLAELLQRSGIQLGGVSVGAQGQGTGQGTSADTRAAERTRSPAGAARVAGGVQGADSLATPASLRPRADGSQPLDVFV
ncbi:MAG: flagellar hook-length control protein FliK [Hydrogenophaga sp.]|nr:flagellar hook-length control protein FliK [Hydrogenophaga sp.]